MWLRREQSLLPCHRHRKGGPPQGRQLFPPPGCGAYGGRGLHPLASWEYSGGTDCHPAMSKSIYHGLTFIVISSVIRNNHFNITFSKYSLEQKLEISNITNHRTCETWSYLCVSRQPVLNNLGEKLNIAQVRKSGLT